MVLRRRMGALAAVPLLTLAATACGGGDDGTAPDDGKGRATSTPAPDRGDGTGTLSEAELEKAALKDGGRVGDHPVSAYAMERPSEDFMEYRADKSVCQPLVSLAKGATDHDPAAEVNRRVDLGDEPLAPQVAVQLRSYDSGEAAEVFAALRKAGTACADGFTEDRALAKAPYLAVEAVRAPDLGDEAVAYRLRVKDVKGELTLTEYLTVVRSGATTLSFRLEPLSAEDLGGVPEELVSAQWKAFEKATG